MPRLIRILIFTSLFGVTFVSRSLAQAPPTPESKGGWKTLLPASGEPSQAEKAAITKHGINYDKLKLAWDYNDATSDGATGLIVIHKGVIVGEWYRGGDKNTTYNIYSSSKAYTSMAYGLLLAESKKVALDTKVYTHELLPEGFPLSDPRKADITVQHLLQMASGIGPDALKTEVEPFEIALGMTDKSPFALLKSPPGDKFFYSNAGVAHLVLLFPKFAGKDLFPYLKERVFDKVGMEKISWNQIGGQEGKLGPLSQGYSGIMTTPREHARYCFLALHKGKWSNEQVVPESYYDFAWTPSKANASYGAQWWLHARHKFAPADFVSTQGAYNNCGYVLPSRDLIFVRLGNGQKFTDKDFDQHLVAKVLDALPSPFEKWEKEIGAYEAADKKSMPPSGGIVFIGSSSTRLWKTLAQDFPDHKVINRGFGGSQIIDSVHFADRVVIPYAPKLIILQAGGNDINARKSPETVLDDFRAFVSTVRAKLPDTRIAFFAVTPSGSRWSQREKQQKANALIKAYVATEKNVDFIPLWDEFLGADGQPRAELFVADRLHNNAEGYKIRAKAVREYLQSTGQ